MKKEYFDIVEHVLSFVCIQIRPNGRDESAAEFIDKKSDVYKQLQHDLVDGIEKSEGRSTEWRTLRSLMLSSFNAAEAALYIRAAKRKELTDEMPIVTEKKNCTS